MERKTYKFEADLLVTSPKGGEHRKTTKFEVTKRLADWKLSEHKKIEQFLTMGNPGDGVQIIEFREID